MLAKTSDLLREGSSDFRTCVLPVSRLSLPAKEDDSSKLARVPRTSVKNLEKVAAKRLFFRIGQVV